MGKIESPRSDAPLFDDESIVIKGWLHPRREVALLIDRGLVTKFTPDRPRPEIAAEQNLPDNVVGFEIKLKPSAALGKHAVDIADLTGTGVLHSDFEIHPKAHLPAQPFYVVTHERSGTHFLMNTLLRNTLVRAGQAGFPDWFGPYDNPQSREKDIKYITDNWNLVGGIVSMLKTHADHDLYAAHYHPAQNLYVLRDPRDTLTSFFHYLNSDSFHRNNAVAGEHRCASFSEFLRRPLTPFLRWSYSLNGQAANVVERWARHAAGWQNAENTLIVHYEDLKQDYEAVLERVVKFLGLRLQAVRRPIGLLDEPSVLPRKGVIGDWRTLFSADDEAFLRKTVEAAGVPWDQQRWK